MTWHVIKFLTISSVLLFSVGAAVAQEPEPETIPESEAKPDQTVNRREALQILADAELAFEQGQSARAIALAREAQRLYPESKAVAGFLAAMEADTAGPRATSAAHNRAKAHLAAALTRSQVLMQQRRYTEALDLLDGIIQAAEKFPSHADVTLYRDLAQKELIEYRIAVQLGKIRPSQAAPLPRPITATDEPRSADNVAPALTAAPTNAYRLAQVKEQVPAWYARTKAALRKNMTVDYRAMPLGLVLDDIQQATGVAVTIDSPVQAAKTTLTVLVDLRVNTVPAETILMIATQLGGCEYVLLEKGIVVTTSDKAGDYIRMLPDSVANHWSRARYLFPDLYLEAMANRPLPELHAEESLAIERKRDTVPAYLRSGRDLIGHIEQLLR